MVLEKLEIKWPCNCVSHNCVVLKNSNILTARDIMLFAILNNAYCVCEKDCLISTFFIRFEGRHPILNPEGNEKKQHPLNYEELNFFLNKG